MRFLLSFVLVAAAGALIGVSADQVTISGIVTDSVTSKPIAGAIVAVRSGTGIGMGSSHLDTTVKDGSYSIVLANDTSGSIRVSVSATGYQNNFMGQTFTIEKPKDGVADVVTANLKVRPIAVIPTDTTHITITALVLDSSNRNAPLAGATVTVTSLGGGGGTTILTATGITNAAGQLVLSEPWGTATLGASASATKTGYTAGTAFAQMQRDSIKIGTIKLIAIKAGDSLTFTFNGVVSNSQPQTVGGAAVSVELKAGTSILFTGLDTTTANGNQKGRYSVTKKIAYVTGLSVTIRVSLAGYQTFDTTFAPAAGTNTNAIILKQATGILPSVSHGIAVPQSFTKSAVFSVNGRAVPSVGKGMHRNLLLQPSVRIEKSGLTVSSSMVEMTK